MYHLGLNLLNWQKSDWSIADVVIWDRHLYLDDMKLVSNNMLASLCGSGYYWSPLLTECTVCPISSSVVDDGYCVCPPNTYISSSNACTACPSESTSNLVGSWASAGLYACTCSTPNYYFAPSGCMPYFSVGVNGSTPWGIYRAQNYDPINNKLIEAQGTGRDVLTSGTITSSSSKGNGAQTNVTAISGGTSSTLAWPEVTLSSFTICSISRYTGGATDYVLGNYISGSYFLHGHWAGNRGVASYSGTWTTLQTSRGVLTDWLVLCGQNGYSVAAPYNVIADGKLTYTNLYNNNLN